jgi:hypothetical protein
MDLDIRFYDNEKDNWDKDMAIHFPQIEFIEVDNFTPNVFISSESLVGTMADVQRRLNQAYIDVFASQGNTYAEFLDNVIKSGSVDETKIKQKDYPNNGFGPYIQDLMSWAKTEDPRQKIVIFDWDKTMTVVEGMYFGEHAGESIMNIDIKNIAEFVMGGERRLTAIKSAIAELMSMRVQIFIITNNPNASLWVPSRIIYLNLISLIFNILPDVANNILYCSRNYGFAKWKSACFIDILRPQLPRCPDDPNSLTKYKGKLSATENSDADPKPKAKAKKRATTGENGMRPAPMEPTIIRPVEMRAASAMGSFDFEPPATIRSGELGEAHAMRSGEFEPPGEIRSAAFEPPAAMREAVASINEATTNPFEFISNASVAPVSPRRVRQDRQSQAIPRRSTRTTFKKGNMGGSKKQMHKTNRKKTKKYKTNQKKTYKR